MVAQKITVSPRQGDDNRAKFNSNQRPGFFSNESRDSTFSEIDRDRSLKVRKEPTGQWSARSNPQRKNRVASTVASGHFQLLRGKRVLLTELLKPEPLFSNTMFNNTDCEFFQDLVQWCGAPAEGDIVQSIDSQKMTEEARAYHTDTLHTPFSPQGGDVFDANSPSAPTYNQSLSYPVSPTDEGIAKSNVDIFYNTVNKDNIPFPEEFLDISTLPVVIGDFASESVSEMNPWLTTEFTWQNPDNLDYTKPTSNTHNTMPFIDQEDSLDMKFASVIPREVESNNVVISEYIINEKQETKPAPEQPCQLPDRRSGGLSLDVAGITHSWPGEVISTPEVLSYVEQLEKEKCTLQNSNILDNKYTFVENTDIADSPMPPVDYEPITPKSEPQVDSEEDIKLELRKRRRNDSEDSDASYTPYTEHRPRKYKKRKPSIPIKDMIRALEGAQQQTKARRGRPPKRRESVVSTISENSSVSTHEMKYRELRDKNNEASKRSRMNRKLKELQMEQMADDLEERNKRLRVRADLLEEATKKLRDAFMLAVSQKKVG